MTTTSWTDLEDEALQGLPLEAQVLYLRGLRRHMDYETGLVGARRRISWQMLAEVIEVEHHQGVAAVKATKQKLRRLVAWLKKRGLVEQQNEGRYLVFRLPLADTDSSVSKKAGPRPYHVRTTKAGPRPYHKEQKENNDIHQQGAKSRATRKILETQKADTHPVSGIRDIGVANATVEFAARTSTAERVRRVFEYWRQASGRTRAKLDDKRKRAIAARLRDGYSTADLMRAVDGCMVSPWHQGKNDRGRKYDDIELICRNASKVDQFIALFDEHGQKQAELDAFLGDDGRDDVIDGEVIHG